MYIYTNTIDGYVVSELMERKYCRLKLLQTFYVCQNGIDTTKHHGFWPSIVTLIEYLNVTCVEYIKILYIV